LRSAFRQTDEGHPGLWIENSEGAKFWLRVMNELKNRGVSDVLIAVVDGFKGFPESTPFFRKRSSKPASCILFAIRWISPPGKTAKSSPAH
jgi:hypothetical protein